MSNISHIFRLRKRIVYRIIKICVINQEAVQMKFLWNYYRKKEWSRNKKVMAFVLLNILCCGIIGFGVWTIISQIALKTITWLVVFVGYSVFFPGYLGGILTVYRMGD